MGSTKGTVAQELLSVHEARLISIAAQRLDLVAPPKSPPGKSDVLKMIRALGSVQLDTISVVARSHETVLWSRLGQFDTALVDRLYHPGKLVTEYWAHAAAIVPVESLIYFRRRMDQYKNPTSAQAARWEPDVEENASVLATIRERGPLSTRAFERPDGPRPAAWTWWGGKPAKKALDFLWTSGELTVVKRESGFQRVYDLMERRFPELDTQPLPSVEEQRRYFVTRALSALGIGTSGWVTDYFRSGSQACVSSRDTTAELRALAAEGVIVPVKLANSPETLWMDPAYLPLLSKIRRGKVQAERTTLLSPFDSLIWHRPRTLTLFDFDYRIECYTPAPLRIYGYYTLSILHRGHIVGRLDPSYDRKRRILTIKAIHLEPGVPVTTELAEELVAALQDYCVFLGGGTVDLQMTLPDQLRLPMSRVL